MKIKVVRSQRKTIAMQVCADATLKIRAPIWVEESTIRKFLHKHESWIKKKKSEIRKRQKNNPEKHYCDGELFLFLGKYYPLQRVRQQQDPLQLKGGHFLLGTDIDNPKAVFKQWYFQKATEKITQWVEWYAQKYHFNVHKVKISNAQKQWGSCTPLNNLHFSWRLMMAPESIIRYVVVHELVHLRERNHSRLFWSKVQGIFPDYKQCRQWLKRNGYLLHL